MHPLTLRFPSAELEREFRSRFRAAGLKPARATYLLVIAIYLGYALLDRTVAPSIAQTLWWIRIAVAAIIAAAFLLTYAPLWHRMRSWIVGASALAAAGGMMAMTAYAPAEIGELYYTGIGLTIIGTCTLFLLRVQVALMVSLAIVVAYEITYALLDFPLYWILVGTFFLGASTLLGGFAAYAIERFARMNFLHERAVEEERARSERLLLNVLPPPVAERLKREAGPIAEHHSEASVLFADICDFTTLSAAMSAEALVRLLNAVFSEFDQIAARHGLEKIKTIGDAYMAVGGVPVAQADHLERVVDAALAMREAIAHRHGDDRRLEIRIGIDTGPVIAGVIGESKFIYDLWGDPVTTASRMESHGLPGAIQVTAAVEERLRGRYRTLPRGVIEVKGKGRMAVWLLEGREASGPRRLANLPLASVL